MNTEKANMFLDLLKILPLNLECYIQAPSLENDYIKSIAKKTVWGFYNLVIINKENIDLIISQEVKTSFSIYIQRIEIKKNNLPLFEGFDGMEYGFISNKIIIPEWFRNLYIPDACNISADW